MGQSVAGVQYPAAIGRIDGHTNYATREYVVANGVTINAGDFVYFASGVVTNATVNQARLVGMAEGTATGNSSGTVTVLVCIDPMMRYLVKSTTSLAVTNNTNANVGQYFDISGSTGNQVAAVNGTTAGALVLVDVPGTTTMPNTGLLIPSGINVGIFCIVNNYLNPYVAG